MRLIVTRPRPQADAWVARLQAEGLDAAALPLLRIAGVNDVAPLREAWQQLEQQALLMFVSPNAVSHFFAQRPAGRPWPSAVLAAGPGPGTAQALRDAGVPASQVIEPAASAAQFDSEALWQRLSEQPWRGRRVLVVRGDGGREWLAEQLRDAGAEVRAVQAYGRAEPQPDAAEGRLLGRALAQPQAHLWLFSSAEAIGYLPGLAPGADWSAARALASHPRIAERARALGVGQVIETAPSLAAVVEAARALARR